MAAAQQRAQRSIQVITKDIITIIKFILKALLTIPPVI